MTRLTGTDDLGRYIYDELKTIGPTDVFYAERDLGGGQFETSRVLGGTLLNAVPALGDGTTDAQAAFEFFETTNEGKNVDLRNGTYVVDSVPFKNQYYNGQFKVGSSIVRLQPAPYESPFGKCGIQAALPTREAHVGFNSGILATNAISGKCVLVYRKAEGHELTNGAQIWASDTYDIGRTTINQRVIYRDGTPRDTRNFVSGVMGSGRIGIVASRRAEDTTYGDPVFIYSDDAGVTWSSLVITGLATNDLNFHGNLVNYPTSAGGSDSGGWIAYSYGNGGHINALYTLDNGATWTLAQAVANDVTPFNNLSEMAVYRLGTENKWIMVLRSEENNACAFKATNPLEWIGPYDTGLPLKNNPPQLIYEWGRFWFIGFSRGNRQFVDGFGNYLAIASAPATELWDNNVDFSAITGWRPLTTVEDWASGYLHPYKIRGQWYASYVAGELSAGGKETTLNIIGDFIPSAVNAQGVARTVSRPNLIVNPQFEIAQRGTTFNVTGTTPTPTLDGWHAACDAGDTVVVSQGTFALDDTYGNFPASPKNYIRIASSVIAGTSRTHYLATRIPDARRLTNRRGVLSFWSRMPGTLKVITQIYLRQVFGTGGSPSATVTVSLGGDRQQMTSWQYNEIPFNFSNLQGKTLGSNNDDYIWLQFYTLLGNETPYILDIADIKLEEGTEASQFEREEYAIGIMRCRERFQKTCAQGTAPLTALASPGTFQARARGTETSHGVDFNWTFSPPMIKAPTVTVYNPLSGAAGTMRNYTSGNDLSASAIGVTNSGCCITNTSATTSGDAYAVEAIASVDYLVS